MCAMRIFCRYYSIHSASASLIEKANDFFVFIELNASPSFSFSIYNNRFFSENRKKCLFGYLAPHLNSKTSPESHFDFTFFFQTFSIEFAEREKMSVNRIIRNENDRFTYIRHIGSIRRRGKADKNSSIAGLGYSRIVNTFQLFLWQKFLIFEHFCNSKFAILSHLSDFYIII